MRWTWDWISLPHSEQFGDNMVFDCVRVAAVVLTAILICATARVLVESRRRRDVMPRQQVARFVGLALATGSLAATEIALVGTVATPRLVVTILALGFSLYGVWGMRLKQLCDPPVR